MIARERDSRYACWNLDGLHFHRSAIRRFLQLRAGHQLRGCFMPFACTADLNATGEISISCLMLHRAELWRRW